LSISPHLVRRGNTYHFRIAVPRGLVAQLGKVEIKTTLKTSDPLTAKQRSRVLSNAIETLFDELRRMPALTRRAVEDRVKVYFRHCLEKSYELSELLPEDKREWDRDAEVVTLRQRVDDLKKLLANREFSPALEREVLEILHPDEPDAEKGDIETFRHACNLVLRAKIEDAKLLAAEFMGEPASSTDPIFAGMRMEGYPPLPGEERKPISGVVIRRAEDVAEDEQSITYAELFSQYYKHMHKIRKVAPRTLLDLQRANKLGLEIIEPSRPISRITANDVRGVRDLIANLPVHLDKNERFKGMIAKQSVQANAEVDAPIISYTTQNKLFSFFMMPLRWASEDELIAVVPGAKISIVEPKLDDDTEKKRKPYDHTVLPRIFSSPLFAGCASASRRSSVGQYLFKDGLYWVPIVAFYTGMRLSEVVQLATEDVREENGIWFIDIRHGVIPKTGEVKRLKNNAAVRKVPLDDDLIKLGFLDVVHRAEKGGRIFPEIKFGSDGTPSKNFTKFWTRYGRAVGFYAPDNVFHSLRHGMVDMTREGKLHMEASNVIVGHTQPGVRSQYGKGMSLAALKEETDKIKPPIDLVSLLMEAQQGKIDVAGTEWGSKLHIRKRPLSLTSPKLPSNLKLMSKAKLKKSTQPPKDQSPS
jgi:integrase